MDPCLVPGAGGEQACKEQINDRWACRYRPAVQVMDNWEWCNAEHDGESGKVVGEKGYYGSEKQCDFDVTANKNSAEYYDGFIYVIP